MMLALISTSLDISKSKKEVTADKIRLLVVFMRLCYSFSILCYSAFIKSLLLLSNKPLLRGQPLLKELLFIVLRLRGGGSPS